MDEVFAATRASLAACVQGVPLTDTLLRRPPFSFLHAIALEALAGAGIADALFSADEQVAAQIKARNDKIRFLVKLISCVAIALGDRVDVFVSPAKIVAGQEPDKTNMLLQKLGEAVRLPQARLEGAARRTQEIGVATLHKKAVRVRQLVVRFQARLRGAIGRRRSVELRAALESESGVESGGGAGAVAGSESGGAESGGAESGGPEPEPAYRPEDVPECMKEPGAKKPRRSKQQASAQARMSRAAASYGLSGPPLPPAAEPEEQPEEEDDDDDDDESELAPDEAQALARQFAVMWNLSAAPPGIPAPEAHMPAALWREQVLPALGAAPPGKQRAKRTKKKKKKTKKPKRSKAKPSTRAPFGAGRYRGTPQPDAAPVPRGPDRRSARWWDGEQQQQQADEAALDEDFALGAPALAPAGAASREQAPKFVVDAVVAVAGHVYQRRLRLLDLFRAADLNGDGFLSVFEFKELLRLVHAAPLKSAQAAAALWHLDVDGDGYLNLSDLAHVVRQYRTVAVDLERQRQEAADQLQQAQPRRALSSAATTVESVRGPPSPSSPSPSADVMALPPPPPVGEEPGGNYDSAWLRAFDKRFSAALKSLEGF